MSRASRACERYVTIIVHFMQHDWNMKSYVLQTRHLDVSHTGVNIGHVLQEAVTEWKLPTENEIVLVTMHIIWILLQKQQIYILI